MTYACRITSAAAIVSLGCAASQGVPAGSGVERVQIVHTVQGEDVVVTTEEGTVTSEPVDSPLPQVWAALWVAYAELGIPLAIRDTVRTEIGNTGFRPRRIGGMRLSEYLECGRGITATPNADRYDVTVSLKTRLREAEGGGTVLTTELNATAKPRDVSTNAVRCSSKGTLESRIVEGVKGALRAANPS